MYKNPSIFLAMERAVDFEWCHAPTPLGDGVSFAPQPWLELDDVWVLVNLWENENVQLLEFEGESWALRSRDPYGLRLFESIAHPGHHLLIRPKSIAQIVVKVRASHNEETNSVRLVFSSFCLEFSVVGFWSPWYV